MKSIDLFTQTRNPLAFSQIALGTDHFDELISREDSLKVLDTYYENGGRLLDTAHLYSQPAPHLPSKSEELIGYWLTDRKLHDKVIVCTKGAFPPNRQISRINDKEIRSDLFSSLKSLQRDSIDLWFLHRDDLSKSVEEIVDIVSPLVDEGYIKHLGVSNWRSDRIQGASDYAKKTGKHPFVISQIQWSLAVSTPESWNDHTIVVMTNEDAQWYKENNFPVMVYSAQGKGIVPIVLEKGVDAVSDKVKERFLLDENLGRIKRCGKLAKEKGLDPAGVSLAYLTNAPFPTIPIVSSSKPSRIIESINYADIKLTQEERDYLITE